MFANIVKNLYVGKSKIDFVMDGKPIPQTEIIGNIGQMVENLLKACQKWRLPDYKIYGDIIDIATMEISNDPSKASRVLYITGIPKDAPSLDPYRLDPVLWQSYYEDAKHGYLFQLTPSRNLIELKYK